MGGLGRFRSNCIPTMSGRALILRAGRRATWPFEAKAGKYVAYDLYPPTALGMGETTANRKVEDRGVPEAPVLNSASSIA